MAIDRLDGTVGEEIIRVADEWNVDGIDPGGQKRSGVQKVLIGSTALVVILSAVRSVTITG